MSDLAKHGYRAVVLSVCAVFACRTEPVVARVGDETFRLSDVRRAYEAARADVRERYLHDPKAFVLEQLVLPEALVREGRRLGLTGSQTEVIAAMQQRLRDEVQSRVTDADVLETDLAKLVQGDPRYVHLPERINVVAMIFASATDAATVARGARGVSIEGFRALYAKQAARLAETWDFDVTRDPDTGWPPDVIDALFAAQPGAVLGPFTAKVAPLRQERSYLLAVAHHLPETNSFAQLKPMLQMMARDVNIQTALTEALRAHAKQETTFFDEQVLATVDFAAPVVRQLR